MLKKRAEMLFLIKFGPGDSAAGKGALEARFPRGRGFDLASRTGIIKAGIKPANIWARRDSNPRPKDYESSALPLRHRPVTT